jgi:hypothetical protein
MGSAQHSVYEMPQRIGLGNTPRRERLWNEAGGLCHWCHKPTVLVNSPVPLQATIDHVIPRCRGGADTLDNVVNSCLKCNQDRNKEDMLKPGHPGYAKPRSSAKTVTAAMDVLRQQRDQAQVQLRAQNTTIKELYERIERMERMSVWKFMRRKLSRWIE